jgi:hypothetical protein
MKTTGSSTSMKNQDTGEHTETSQGQEGWQGIWIWYQQSIKERR